MPKFSKPVTSTPINSNRRLVLSEVQWNTINSVIDRPKEEKKLNEEEQKHLEFLKEESKKLISKWPEKKDENELEDKETVEMSNGK